MPVPEPVLPVLDPVPEPLLPELGDGDKPLTPVPGEGAVAGAGVELWVTTGLGAGTGAGTGTGAGAGMGTGTGAGAGFGFTLGFMMTVFGIGIFGSLDFSDVGVLIMPIVKTPMIAMSTNSLWVKRAFAISFKDLVVLEGITNMFLFLQYLQLYFTKYKLKITI